MVEHTLKDSKVEMAEDVFESGRGELGEGGRLAWYWAHSHINPEKLRIYFSQENSVFCSYLTSVSSPVAESLVTCQTVL